MGVLEPRVCECVSTLVGEIKLKYRVRWADGVRDDVRKSIEGWLAAALARPARLASTMLPENIEYIARALVTLGVRGVEIRVTPPAADKVMEMIKQGWQPEDIDVFIRPWQWYIDIELVAPNGRRVEFTVDNVLEPDMNKAEFARYTLFVERLEGIVKWCAERVELEERVRRLEEEKRRLEERLETLREENERLEKQLEECEARCEVSCQEECGEDP